MNLAFAVRCALVVAILAAVPPESRCADTVPVLLDTQIGSGVDDAFALALAVASPELELQGVTTVAGDAETRAWMACRFLAQVGRRETPVAWGRAPQAELAIDGQIQYRRHPALIFNRMGKPLPETAVDFLYRTLKAQPGKLTLIATGPLTNIARLVGERPDSKPWIKRVVLLSESLKADIPAAKAVFASGVPLTVVPGDVTIGKLADPQRQRLFQACTQLTFQLQSLFQLADQPMPSFAAPAAVALYISDRFSKLEDQRLEVNDEGGLRSIPGEPNARVVTAWQSDEFLEWCTDRIAAGKPALPQAPANRSSPIARGGMPNRVHACEDFETDIERRWWMSGKAETALVPPGSTRACRGVLTQDFDDRQGDRTTMYNAVIFNPVPGPPMGKSPRLSFRCWLDGTDTLRVQIYSLTNGYHRYLSLAGLPQRQWQSLAVDMTQVRRPDGSGGPLSENERIDDIQFYVDPRAELVIDDIVLYDAATPGDTRDFPRQVHFTGWFDTGKQGKEWPGTFDIVPEQGYFWKAARSVDNSELGHPWIRLHLRGERPLGQATRVRFRYRVTGADNMRIALVDSASASKRTADVQNLVRDQWAEATAEFATGSQAKADELHFLAPKGAELLIDDVLIFTPEN